MKRMISCILALLSSAMILSAQRTTVTGAVLDSLSRQEEPAAVLQFFKAPDAEKPVAFTTTGTDGRFSRTTWRP